MTMLGEAVINSTLAMFMGHKGAAYFTPEAVCNVFNVYNGLQVGFAADETDWFMQKLIESLTVPTEMQRDLDDIIALFDPPPGP